MELGLRNYETHPQLLFKQAVFEYNIVLFVYLIYFIFLTEDVQLEIDNASIDSFLKKKNNIFFLLRHFKQYLLLCEFINYK